MRKKVKCHECKGPTFEMVSVKDPDQVTLVCFKCGVIVKTCHIDDEIDDEEELGNSK